MSLVLTDGSVAEAQRILAAASHADVLRLDLHAATATGDTARQQYADLKKALYTRHSFGIDVVTRAKARLDQAFNALCAQPQIDAARAALARAGELALLELQALRSIALHTYQLEARVRQLQQQQEQEQERDQDAPPAVSA